MHVPIFLRKNSSIWCFILFVESLLEFSKIEKGNFLVYFDSCINQYAGRLLDLGKSYVETAYKLKSMKNGERGTNSK